MLQKEVAERLAASPGTEHYGRLSVMVQYHCKVTILFDVPPRSFSPPPQENSSIVMLTPHRKLPCYAKDYAMFESIVKHAFGQRRKTLRNSLKDIVSDDIWESISIHSNLRPEVLSVKDFVEIANACR
jgi:16S rRNA (adenine1518-N6/adenine1519-N6)-dimethyltransferase